MSRISKKKLIKALKGEYEYNASVNMTRQQVMDMFEKPVSQKEWLKGYKRWKKQQEEGGF